MGFGERLAFLGIVLLAGVAVVKCLPTTSSGKPIRRIGKHYLARSKFCGSPSYDTRNIKKNLLSTIVKSAFEKFKEKRKSTETYLPKGDKPIIKKCDACFDFPEVEYPVTSSDVWKNRYPHTRFITDPKTKAVFFDKNNFPEVEYPVSLPAGREYSWGPMYSKTSDVPSCGPFTRLSSISNIAKSKWTDENSAQFISLCHGLGAKSKNEQRKPMLVEDLENIDVAPTKRDISDNDKSTSVSQNAAQSKSQISTTTVNNNSDILQNDIREFLIKLLQSSPLNTQATSHKYNESYSDTSTTSTTPSSVLPIDNNFQAPNDQHTQFEDSWKSSDKILLPDTRLLSTFENDSESSSPGQLKKPEMTSILSTGECANRQDVTLPNNHCTPTTQSVENAVLKSEQSTPSADLSVNDNTPNPILSTLSPLPVLENNSMLISVLDPVFSPNTTSDRPAISDNSLQLTNFGNTLPPFDKNTIKSNPKSTSDNSASTGNSFSPETVSSSPTVTYSSPENPSNKNFNDLIKLTDNNETLLPENSPSSISDMPPVLTSLLTFNNCQSFNRSLSIDNSRLSDNAYLASSSAKPSTVENKLQEELGVNDKLPLIFNEPVDNDQMKSKNTIPLTPTEKETLIPNNDNTLLPIDDSPQKPIQNDSLSSNDCYLPPINNNSPLTNIVNESLPNNENNVIPTFDDDPVKIPKNIVHIPNDTNLISTAVNIKLPPTFEEPLLRNDKNLLLPIDNDPFPVNINKTIYMIMPEQPTNTASKTNVSISKLYENELSHIPDLHRRSEKSPLLHILNQQWSKNFTAVLENNFQAHPTTYLPLFRNTNDSAATSESVQSLPNLPNYMWLAVPTESASTAMFVPLILVQNISSDVIKSKDHLPNDTNLISSADNIPLPPTFEKPLLPNDKNLHLSINNSPFPVTINKTIYMIMPEQPTNTASKTNVSISKLYENELSYIPDLHIRSEKSPLLHIQHQPWSKNVTAVRDNNFQAQPKNGSAARSESVQSLPNLPNYMCIAVPTTESASTASFVPLILVQNTTSDIIKSKDNLPNVTNIITTADNIPLPPTFKKPTLRNYKNLLLPIDNSPFPVTINKTIYMIMPEPPTNTASKTNDSISKLYENELAPIPDLPRLSKKSPLHIENKLLTKMLTAVLEKYFQAQPTTNLPLSGDTNDSSATTESVQSLPNLPNYMWIAVPTKENASTASFVSLISVQNTTSDVIKSKEKVNNTDSFHELNHLDEQNEIIIQSNVQNVSLSQETGNYTLMEIIKDSTDSSKLEKQNPDEFYSVLNKSIVEQLKRDIVEIETDTNLHPTVIYILPKITKVENSSRPSQEVDLENNKTSNLAPSKDIYNVAFNNDVSENATLPTNLMGQIVTVTPAIVSEISNKSSHNHAKNDTSTDTTIENYDAFLQSENHDDPPTEYHNNDTSHHDHDQDDQYKTIVIKIIRRTNNDTQVEQPGPDDDVTYKTDNLVIHIIDNQKNDMFPKEMP